MDERAEEFAYQPPVASGPRSWLNWRAQLAGDPICMAVELKLYTDAWIIASARHGPYYFQNTVPEVPPGGRFVLTPSIALRVEQFLPSDLSDMSVTSDEHYHGGHLYDEVAALAALILGARFIAGAVDREFHPADPAGRPRAQAVSLLPSLPTAAMESQIPWLFEQRDLRELTLLDTLPSLDQVTAMTLVKSARLFQQALWICDTAPETAWLLLVAALETAAGRWEGTTMPAVERLERSFPRLAELLTARKDPELAEEVAEILAPLSGATAKFIRFCTAFKAEEPTPRPTHGAFDFSLPSYKDAIAKIYHYRSRALHGGTPFPYPMCHPPMRLSVDGGAYEERPSGLGAASRGATWLREDLPMHLHLFADITRHSLLAWWRSLACPSTNG